MPRPIPQASIPQRKLVDVPREEILDAGIVSLCGSIGHDRVMGRRLAFGRSRQLYLAAQHDLAVVVEEAKVLALAPARAGSISLYTGFDEGEEGGVLTDD